MHLTRRVRSLFALPSAIALISAAIAGGAFGHAGAAVAHLQPLATGDAYHLASAPIPASCEHKAVTLSGGRYYFGSLAGAPGQQHGSRGEALLDYQHAVYGELSGHRGRVALAVLDCDAGGVAWPEWLLAYGPGPTLLGGINMGDHNWRHEHATLSHLTIARGRASFRDLITEGADSDASIFLGSATFRDGKLRYVQGAPLALDYSTLYGDNTTANTPDGAVVGSMRTTQMKYAPASLQRYVARQWVAERQRESGDTTTCSRGPRATVYRYSSKGYAYDTVSRGCHDGRRSAARFLAHYNGAWHTLSRPGSDVRLDCSAAVKSTRTRIGKLARALGLSCVNGKGTRTSLGAWPMSGA